MSNLITPIRVKGLAPPMMRPLPTIFTYARLTAGGGGSTTDLLDQEYQAHLTALVEIIGKAGSDADVPRSKWQGLADLCIELAQKKGEELAAGLDAFCAELTRLHAEHGRELKKAVAETAEEYRELFRSVVRPKTMVLCSADPAAEPSDSLERKLVERCYYDCVAVGADWTATPTSTADLVIFAPIRQPVPRTLLDQATRGGLPFLIMMGISKTGDMPNMALMKSEHLYRKSGYEVLHHPFNPPRLYSTIDAICLRRLAAKVLPLPQAVAAAARARAVGDQG